MREWFQKLTFHELLKKTSEQYPDKIALKFESESWTFSSFTREVDRTASSLLKLGIKKQDKVAIWMPNRPEWLFCLFALSSIGAITVPINTRFRRTDIEYILSQSDTSVLITADISGPINYLDILTDACEDLGKRHPGNVIQSKTFPELKKVVTIGNSHLPSSIPWDTFLLSDSQIPNSNGSMPELKTSPDDTVLIMYTSGTTGFPKGVMHNHNILRTIEDASNRMGYTNEDVILMYLPLFHCFGLYEGPLMSITSGCSMILLDRFDPGLVLEQVEQNKVSVMNGFDTHFFDLLNHPNLHQTNLKSLRTILFAAGMEASESVAIRAQTELCPTVTAWGMTEVGVGATRSFLDSPNHERCSRSGFPLPGYEFKIINPETGLQCPHDTPGELCVRGYAVMQGYYKKPEDTEAAIDLEGWFHSGDVATMSANESIRFLGRYKDQLKVGGENVDPVEVEAFLQNHPSIEKVQIVGVPDGRLNEVPCACIITPDNSCVDLTDIEDFCKGQLASFKIPKHLVLMKEFPMTSSGKVQKFVLREQVADKLKLNR